MTSRKPSSCSIELAPVRLRQSSFLVVPCSLCWLLHALPSSLLLSSPRLARRIGKISFEDFGTVVRAVGLNPSEKELEGAGSGEKDLGAVQAFVKQLDESKPSKSDVESKVSRLPARSRLPTPACAPPDTCPSPRVPKLRRLLPTVVSAARCLHKLSSRINVL